MESQRQGDDCELKRVKQGDDSECESEGRGMTTSEELRQGDDHK